MEELRNSTIKDYKYYQMLQYIEQCLKGQQFDPIYIKDIEEWVSVKKGKFQRKFVIMLSKL